MSFQWTIIAGFLYLEIIAVILLLLPFISPARWQKIFKSKVLKGLENQSLIYFSVFIVLLVIFFIDSIREMRKYGHERAEAKDSHSSLDQEMQYSMKIFRAQRNFYIAGFALFLWLVLRRLVTLISTQATLQANHDAAVTQARNATDTAQKMMTENDKTDEAVGDTLQNQGNVIREAHEKEVRLLNSDLQDSRDELDRTKKDLRAMQQQAESVSKEYDRLLKEHAKLQELREQGSKKDE